MVVSRQILEGVTQTLGQKYLPELIEGVQQIDLLEPEMGKLFWQSQDAEPGLFIILAGRVRLIDRQNNLLISLESGDSFGEITLFHNDFQPYSIRASANTQICYLRPQLLLRLLQKYPEIKQNLVERAKLRDLLLLYHEVNQCDRLKTANLQKILPNLTNHSLEANNNLPDSLWQQKLWLLRQGELIHSSGEKIKPGQIYQPETLPQTGNWLVASPVDLYSLDQTSTKIPSSPRELLEQGDLDGSDFADNDFTTVDYAARVVSHRLLRRPKGFLKDTPSDNRSAYKTTEPSCSIASTGGTPATAFRAAVTVGQRSPQPTIKNQQSKAVSKAYFPSPKLQVDHFWQQLSQRYPFFLQQSASDCGAACLVMIGRYWGKRFSINRLRELASIDRNGASLNGLANAAEGIGFTTRMVTATLNKLAEQTLPVIAHWQGTHYVVVYKVTSQQVIIADPAIGQLTLSREEFDQGWTGYTLILQPTVLLKKTSEDSSSLNRYFELIKPYRTIIIEIALASIAIQIFGLVVPLLTQLLLDRVIVQRSDISLTAVGSGLLIFGLFRIAMTGLRQYLLVHTANRIDLALIVGFIDRTFRLPLGFFETRYVGDIISRIQENRKIQRFLTGEALSIILDLLTVFLYIGLMLWYSWKLSLMIIALVPLFAVMALIATPFLKRISREIFTAYNQETKYLIQSLTGIRTIKSMAVEQIVRGHWEELFSESIRKNFSGQLISNNLQIISSLIQTLITVGLLWFGAWQVIHNELTIGQLVAFNMLLGNVINPFNRLAMMWNELQEVLIAVERIEDVIDSPLEEDLQEVTRQSLPPLVGHIQFENVTFRYQAQNEVNTLENLSFEVLPGQTVALVGRSGSGKTTISKMTLGFYTPLEGRVLIDGYDINSLSLQSLRSQVGVVDQDTFLFGETIRENISLGRGDANLSEIVQAAKQAGAHEFIQELPMGYETQIGEGGGMLSGGQRQRIAIARALLGNSRLLILDEATSNLDTESERIIQNNLNTITRSRTTLIIAHRLSTVRSADLILVLDRGILVEKGTHHELMAKRGQYYHLNHQQTSVIR
jgi:HlyB family type I secretion system ABC transporter